MKTHSKKLKWTEKEDTLLIDAVCKLGTKSWKAIAECVPERSGKQCRERWLGQLNPKMSKDKWTVDQDIKLINAQKINGNRWSIIAFYLPGRSTISIKNRWSWLLRHGMTSNDYDENFLSSPSNQQMSTPSPQEEPAASTWKYLSPIQVPDTGLFGENFLKFQNELSLICSL